MLISRLKERKGLIQVYTGSGKGKTTAALGQAIRAMGHGFEVCWVYFFKNSEDLKQGEFKILEQLGATLNGFAKKHPEFYEDVSEDDLKKECIEGLDFVKNVFEEDRFDLVVLDEVIIGIRDGFLEEKKLLETIDLKPGDMEVILTGSGSCRSSIVSLFPERCGERADGRDHFCNHGSSSH